MERLTAALADRYRIERELGAGGMATVYLAEDLKHDRKVAVKVLRADLAASLGPERFLREVKIAANLQHPHVLPLYDSGQADGFLYYVMPYVEGTSLRQKLIREGELPIPDAVRILRDVADALAYAHQHGVVHRDIKPENVMLSGRHALVTDFGVAKAVSEATGRQTLTTAGVALGTPAYMAPEQAAADPHTDHRADIYAFGVVAYELLTGRPPFTGASPQAILAAHVTTAADPVTKFRASIPPALAALVMRCLEKKPADRWQSADEIIPQLEAVLTPSGGMTPTYTQPTTAVRSPTRRGLSVLAALAVVLVAVVGYVAWLKSGRGRMEPGDRNAVMVLPFETHVSRQELNGLGAQAAEQIQAAIGQAGLGRVLPRAAGAEGAVTPELGKKLLAETGAGTLVAGTVREVGDSVEVHAQLLRTADLKVLFSLAPERGAASQGEVVIGRVKDRVLAALAMYVDPIWLPGDVTLYGPARNLSAYQKFADGFRKMFINGDLQGEIALLIAAAREDSSYFMPSILLASAYYDLGRLREMDSVDHWVAERRSRLGPGDAANHEWSLARHYGSPEDEYRAAQVGFRLDSLGWSYTILLSAITANRAEDALRHARRRPDTTTALGRNWAPWFSLEIEALHRLGRYEQALKLAREARARQPEKADHLDAEGAQLAALGRMADAESLLTQTYAYSWPLTPGVVMQDFGMELHAHGKLAEAKIMWDRALAWFTSRSLSGQDDRQRRVQVAQLNLLLGRYDVARTRYAELHGGDPGNGEFIAAEGIISARLGDTAGTEAVVRKLLEEPASWLQAERRYWGSRVLGSAGKCEEAVSMLRDALNRGARIYWPEFHSPDWDPIRGCPAFQELIRPR